MKVVLNRKRVMYFFLYSRFPPPSKLSPPVLMLKLLVHGLPKRLPCPTWNKISSSTTNVSKITSKLSVRGKCHFYFIMGFFLCDSSVYM